MCVYTYNRASRGLSCCRYKVSIMEKEGKKLLHFGSRGISIALWSYSWQRRLHLCCGKRKSLGPVNWTLSLYLSLQYHQLKSHFSELLYPMVYWTHVSDNHRILVFDTELKYWSWTARTHQPWDSSSTLHVTGRVWSTWHILGRKSSAHVHRRRFDPTCNHIDQYQSRWARAVVVCI